MGAFRDAVFRQLIAADTHRRLRIVYPAASRAQNVPIFVHSKVMIVDDELVRIGSANFSRRSMGVDTECDLAVDAGGDSRVREGIRRIRDRLLAEHLALPVDVVARDTERAGSLRALVDSRESAEHTLVRVELEAGDEAPPPEALRAAADPDEPIGFGASVVQLVPPVDARARRNPLRLWIPLVVLTVALASTSSAFIRRPEFQAIQNALGAASTMPSWLWIGASAFLLANLALIPLEVVAIVAGVMFGGVRGGLVALRRIADGSDHRLPRWSRDWTGRRDPVDEPAIVPLRPAAGRARCRRRDCPATRVGRERGIGAPVVRRGARSVRGLSGWHSHRLDAGRRRPQRSRRTSSPHAPSSVHVQRSDHHRRPPCSSSALLPDFERSF